MTFIANKILGNKIFMAAIIGGALFNGALPAMAASDPQIKKLCSDAEYRYTHAKECKSFSTKWAWSALGGAAALGGVAAVLGMSGSGGGGNGTGDATVVSVQPTLTANSFNMVGGDIDKITLAGIMGKTDYIRNYDQYNDIRLAWSLARGYTGAGSVIAVLDAGDDTWHGKTVATFASGTVAPNATVQTYKITNNYEFVSYNQIGKIIAAADNANIYNASWTVPMRATDIRSRGQFESLTGKQFVGEMVNATTDRDAIFVWAAGNDGDTQSSALSATPLVVPEMRGHFVNVVAWDNETGALADYSNQCGATMEYCITAPGTNLATEHSAATGTSFAAPIVSAAIAVIREAFPYMNAGEITSLLFETARDLGTPGVDPVYGHGMLDLERATRPVGTALIALDGGMIQPLNTARVSGGIGHQIQSADLKFAYFDKYGRAFQTNMNDNIQIKNPGRAFNRLRALDKTSVQMGGIEFGFKNNELGLGDGFLGATQSDKMTFVGTGHQFNIGNIEFLANASVGFVSPRATEKSMVTNFSNITTASVSVGAKMGDWTFNVAIPDTIIRGNMELRLPSARTFDGTIIYTDHTIDMATAPAFEYAVGYKFMTAGFIDNPYGTDEFYVMAKHKFVF